MTTSGPELENLLIKDCFATLNDPRRTSKENIEYRVVFLILSAVVSIYVQYTDGFYHTGIVLDATGVWKNSKQYTKVLFRKGIRHQFQESEKYL